MQAFQDGDPGVFNIFTKLSLSTWSTLSHQKDLFSLQGLHAHILNAPLKTCGFQRGTLSRGVQLFEFVRLN